ncbi:serine hydrolase [Lysobacter sp. BMK333-48F3]|uniref:serine hydrolase domain-containing protein n=1 Tax=Lysobacter sp. BMK333-48F3 TaxID=2867962 RepID=UPI001C8C45FB|nr:serine hydrolase domain-containing protein [Lysobacter sp. BMK333-48F3]MBX9403369.1 serine hydrolase [Lysobacter sp. BMK333-48F3]
MTRHLMACALIACLLAAPARAQAPTDPELRRLAAAIENGLRPSVAKPGVEVPSWTLQQRMAHYKVPGVAIAIVKDGRLAYAAGYGVREAGGADAVDADTLFSVGSVSKMITAATSLRLVAQGRLELDRDVNGYLKSWRIPQAPGIADPKVSLRMLLSHTSGLSVHGFEDYLPGEPLPSLVQTLDGVAPAKNQPIRLQRTPGARSEYSGGGIMVAQQLIEDVAGQPLDAVARGQVFEPLGMRRSTFQDPLQAGRDNIAKAHDRNGALAALPRGWESFPEQAASGLWTSAHDLGAFVGALIRSYRGEGGLLPQSLTIEMMTEVSPGTRGLGPELLGSGRARRFTHNGDNENYHAVIEGYPETGYGFAILTNGKNAKGLRGEIRNAISDALADGVKPLIRPIALELGAPVQAAYAGSYRLDPALPMDVRGALADGFDYPSLQVRVADGTLVVDLPGGPTAASLLPLSPSRFAAPGLNVELEFHRNAHGAVHAVSASVGSARAYYRRETASAASLGRGL